MRMSRRGLVLIASLAVTAILAMAAAVAIWMQTAPPRAPAQNVAAEPVEPLTQEMACIEGVLKNGALEANQVQPALDRCR
ncbi:hypothetical protein [Sphingosinicella sp.]|uniref:hypothetical protein n=1 Tax=Sphingosinicella sp. TaxID=1917971 RepID=UPI0040379261